jgi:Outer membrane protein beta-barrel domain
MKKFLISFTLLLASIFINHSVSAKEMYAQDSMIVQFGKSKIIIFLANKADREKLQEMYDNGTLRNTLRYLEADQLADTALVKDDSGEYRIIKKNGETIIYYDKVKEINKRPNRNFSINIDRNDDNDNNDDGTRRESSNRSYRPYMSYDFGVDFGMNIMIPKSGSLSGTLYELNPLRSNYVALNFMNRINFSKYARARIGLEVAWYNFSFQKDVRLNTRDTGLELAIDPNGLQKSKLAATYLNLPVMLEVGRRWGFTFGVGGYVGYKIDSWTKAKSANGDKQKDHDSYYLTNFRYGVSTQLGLRWIKLFANYDLNSLFVADKATNMNVLSIGVRLM